MDYLIVILLLLVLYGLYSIQTLIMMNRGNVRGNVDNDDVLYRSVKSELINMNVEKLSYELWVLSSEFKTLKNQFDFLNKEKLENMVDKDKYDFLIQEGRDGVGYYEEKVRKLESMIRDIPFEREKFRYENGNVFRKIVKKWVVEGTEERRLTKEV